MKVTIITTREKCPTEPPVERAAKEIVHVWEYCEQKIVKRELWVAEVDDIIKLANELKMELIVIPMKDGETYPTIEIYNDYRE